MTKLVKPRFTTLVLSSFILSMIVPSYGWARSDLDTRVSRLENIVANELNIKLLNQLDAMQQEIRELSGRLEEQQNSVQALNSKQEKLFLNLDQRLNNFSNGNGNAASATAAMPAIDRPITPVLETTPAASKDNLPIPPVSALEHEGTSEESLYTAANALMQGKKYAEAILEFKDLLWQFPEGTYSAHAHYWLGELYMMQWQRNRADNSSLNQAKESFATVTNKYQGQERAGDALLKLGLLEIDLDHFAVAKDLLQQVVTKYPGTARARIAENNLARIEQTHFSQNPITHN